MSDACYCDFEPATVYNATTHVARKQHRCEECRKPIIPGEQYERVFCVFERMAETYRTCPRCLAVRAYVKAHVPCFCWNHGSMLEQAADCTREYAHEAPGMAMEFGRLLLAAEGRPRRKRS